MKEKNQASLNKTGSFAVLLGVVIAGLVVINGCGKEESEKLPYLGPHDVTTRTVDGEKVKDTTYFTIPSFSLVNQDSQVVTNKTLKGKVYVADFFFTSCPTICPGMQKNMLRIQEHYADNEDLRLVSFSIDPNYDTVQLLNKYAENLGADTGQWHFLTGNKDSIFDIAENGYMVAVKESEDAPGGLVHSGVFTLVDRKGRIRGYYDGTKDKEVDALIRDLDKLL